MTTSAQMRRLEALETAALGPQVSRPTPRRHALPRDWASRLTISWQTWSGGTGNG